MDLAALMLSVKLASLTTACLLLVGVPLAAWLAFRPRRFSPLVEALLSLPMVLPPTVLGYYLLVAFAPDSWLGAAFQASFGTHLAFSFAGLWLGSMIYSLPFALAPTLAAFRAVDETLLEAAATLGAGRLKTFFRVVLPSAWPGVLAGAVLAFAHTMGEFGVVLMIGGNVSGETRTLSIALYDQMQALDYAGASKTAFVLLAIAFVALSVTHSVGFRRRA
ncbi:MAG: molybdate ABC transporter permease subunit [Deltaproteobacteria bacterium]|nr:molybdate ABC transporter permease subunit [Deltaproteobacteria bacterium]